MVLAGTLFDAVKRRSRRPSQGASAADGVAERQGVAGGVGPRLGIPQDDAGVDRLEGRTAGDRHAACTDRERTVAEGHRRAVGGEVQAVDRLAAAQRDARAGSASGGEIDVGVRGGRLRGRILARGVAGPVALGAPVAVAAAIPVASGQPQQAANGQAFKRGRVVQRSSIGVPVQYDAVAAGQGKPAPPPRPLAAVIRSYVPGLTLPTPGRGLMAISARSHHRDGIGDRPEVRAGIPEPNSKPSVGSAPEAPPIVRPVPVAVRDSVVGSTEGEIQRPARLIVSGPVPSAAMLATWRTPAFTVVAPCRCWRRSG